MGPKTQICVKIQDSLLLLGCYEARKEASHWTSYASGERTRIKTNHSTEHVFALTALLGFRFAPRLRDALSRHLYLVDEVGAYGPLNTLLFGQVKSKLIIEQWDEMRRVASSIQHGTVSASLLMRKLAAYPRQNQVAKALTEMGKLERTAYLLEYFRDEALRRRVLIGLNKGEALHALARQLFFGRLGELRDRAFEDQMHRASCLQLAH